MKRRYLIASLLLLPGFCKAADILRGKLVKGPALKTAEGKLIPLTGDADTVGVLNDTRLEGVEFEVNGQSQGPDRFTVNPIHTRAMFVHKSGKRMIVTYWCDVCAIRTYTPGICWCCREETALDLREPDTLSSK